MERGRIGNRHRHQVARTRRLATVRNRKVYKSLILCPAGQPVGLSGLPTLVGSDHHFHLVANLFPVFLGRNPVLQVREPFVTLLDYCLRQLVVHIGRRRAGPLGVLEGKGAGKAGGFHNVERGLEVLFGFSGETNNDVGGDGGVRYPLAYPVQDAQELLRPVGPAHILKHLVGAGLQRHMQLRHDVVCFRHRINDVVGECRGVRAGEPYTFQAFDLATGAKQLRKRATVAEFDSIGVDILSQQRHLNGAVVHEGLDFRKDVTRPTVPLLAPQRGNDAEGAGVVAANRDGDPARVDRIALGGKR